MATIKPIEGASIHKIQSGQVIVDLCSVVKELVENSLDAGATAIDVRFKNNGLDAIEVQDNGSGIAKDDYDTIALKHYTSKLSSYEDLTSLQTFGFRGEALSSLCALSNVHIVTAREDEAPKGTRMDFEISGELKNTQIVASQRGTTVSVETIFKNLPVRRQELEKNIKREYGKVLGLLQAYACVTTTSRISVSNVMAKGKKAVVFSTKADQTTRENIANVFGSKTLHALTSLELQFEMQASNGLWNTQEDGGGKQVRVLGHVSRPIFGEGRQTPDRQMFFVNGRPCGLPQVAKVFNEVYKSYNLSQSPFIFANVVLDTNAYDVNVSPDKRTILLHDQGPLLESMKASLTELFDNQQQTVPQSKTTQKLPNYKSSTLSRQNTLSEDAEVSFNIDTGYTSEEKMEDSANYSADSLIQKFAGRNAQDRTMQGPEKSKQGIPNEGLSLDKQRLVRKLSKANEKKDMVDDYEDPHDILASDALTEGFDIPVLDFNRRMAEQQAPTLQESSLQSPATDEAEERIPSINNSPSKPEPGVVQSAFDRMRPTRTPAQTATITIGQKTMTSDINSPFARSVYTKTPIKQVIRRAPRSTQASSQFSSSIKTFAAPGTQMNVLSNETEDSIDEASDTDEEEEAQDDVTGVSPRQDLVSAAKESPPLLYRRRGQGNRSDERRSNPESSANDDSDEQTRTYSDQAETDEEYLDEEAKKSMEEAKVAQLIQEAEERAARPSQDNLKRAQYLLKGGGYKDSTTQLVQTFSTSIDQINQQLHQLEDSLPVNSQENRTTLPPTSEPAHSPEERLSLTVSKEDFALMRIIGQFNLGFIIALRPSRSSPSTPTAISSPELFIIDQHASDEKYNFERLQATTTVQHQRLVHPHPLSLTAIEEETILDHHPSLLKNGFLLSIDDTGARPVGHRCTLLSLPMSKEVTFSARDLEELLVLLAESPPASSSSSTTNPPVPSVGGFATHANVPRPSKVRRMFAMRACRSSVMVGKTLTREQMGRMVGRMGELEKPWNCPHGRPTMRHLLGLGAWEGWRGDRDGRVGGARWGEWVAGMEGGDESDGDDGEGMVDDEESGVGGEYDEEEEEEEDGDDGVAQSPDDSETGVED
ncbi:hypothetical protein MMC17_001770 [Xylographa soralifera]|nr:hypothetical protein [Xylographa soralifera]